MEKLKGYKTVGFNIVMAIVAVVVILSPETEAPSAEDVQGAIDAVEAAVVAVWSVGNVVLRAITNTSIFKKE